MTHANPRPWSVTIGYHGSNTAIVDAVGRLVADVEVNELDRDAALDNAALIVAAVNQMQHAPPACPYCDGPPPDWRHCDGCDQPAPCVRTVRSSIGEGQFCCRCRGTGQTCDDCVEAKRP